MSLPSSAVSRRLSEFIGVALFAAALLWLIALVTFSPTDPVWFFNDGAGDVANFAGRVGAFLAMVSFQLVGYPAFLLPLCVAVIGWHYFWCTKIPRQYAKLTGAGLFVTCLSGILTLAAHTIGTNDGAGGLLGMGVSSLCAHFLNRTGAFIFLLTALALSVILSTQFSFGQAASAAADA
jgi:S-DNA-T family DNA segregation ATPase FtsK/SpoIIIE